MNTAKIYSQSVGRDISIDGTPDIVGEISNNSDLPKVNEDAAHRQAKHQWLASTVTQEFLQRKHAEYESLIEQAINYAKSYYTHQNHYQIISILIRANEIRLIIREQQVK